MDLPKTAWLIKALFLAIILLWPILEQTKTIGNSHDLILNCVNNNFILWESHNGVWGCIGGSTTNTPPHHPLTPTIPRKVII
jgi:hypothetical protein